ncbi:hypothetical protein FQA39_LY05807 [Lamprigera yunnana]|nr:hypothetical protein FQA39_LY05807 [Lamprigera yunnana]
MPATTMFSKFKSSSGPPQSPLDNNPIGQFFEIGKQVASAGPELIWKIHDAYRKSDGKEIKTIRKEMNDGFQKNDEGLKKLKEEIIKSKKEREDMKTGKTTVNYESHKNGRNNPKPRSKQDKKSHYHEESEKVEQFLNNEINLQVKVTWVYKIDKILERKCIIV